MALDRSETVQILSEIWEDLLAVEVDPDDDFFDLGGYSLLVVNVVAEARKRGLRLEANDIYAHKTPAAIAVALSPDGESATVPTANDPDFGSVWETGLSPLETEPAATLVPLAPEGSGTPVFCFHWGTGNVRFMRDLVDSFRGERPAYGLEMAGMWSRERPVLSIAEMATRYLREIRTVQPQGPYLFVGPCAGGRIAYEIARLLEENGESAAVLAVVNTMPPGTTELDPSWGLRELYDFRINSLRSRFEVPDLLTDQERVMRGMVEIAWLDEDVDPADLHWRQAVWAAGIFAQEHYEPRPYGGEVTVFQLAENAAREDADWGRLAAVTETHTYESAGTLPLLREAAFAEALAKKLASFSG
ncbi:thioesterase domain-containing protein [Streptomyces sp. SID12501]|uniref:Peptide synthetase n=1 Tax=Streptomyces sp. SID12501 TaxID=2706042 RepID=A0A6B3BQA6_9ACTN|nr:thioesterase domain-containing protein [Streptomyces sp. SID12501]NEC86502.1 peptide synthetase [Streptomyces sp. SID12501]